MRRLDLPTRREPRGARVLLVLACLVIVVAGLREIRPIAVPLLIAVFLSVLSSPLLGWFLRRRVPKVLAVSITVLTNVAVFALMLLLVGGSVRAFSNSLPVYQERLEAQARATLDWLEERGIDTSQLDWLQEPRDLAGAAQSRPPVALPDDEVAVPVEPGEPPSVTTTGVVLPGATDDGREPEQETFIELWAFVDVVSSTVRSIASLLAMSLLVVLMMVFLLLEAAGLPRRLEVALGWREEDLARLRTMKLQVQHYLGYKTLISAITGVLLGGWVWILDVQFPLLWGLIAFILNYIPSIGSIIAAIPAVLLALADQGPGVALLVVLGYLTVNLTLGNFIEPHLMGRRLGISTLVVFLSLIFWGWLWGPIGMLLSVPLTMILRIALENTEDFRWVAQLIAAKPGGVPTPPALGPEVTLGPEAEESVGASAASPTSRAPSPP